MDASLFSKTELNVLKLIRYAFEERELTAEECAEFDWKEVYDELLNHAVAAVPIESAGAILDEQFFESWLNVAACILSLNSTICDAETELEKLLEKNDIPMGILKGLAAAKNYPKPLYRSLGDVDFIVNETDFDRTYRLMLDNGYILAYDENNTDYHLTFEKNGVMFELHREPAGISKGEYGDIIRDLFRNVCGEAKKCEVEGYTFSLLPRLQNGLVLLLHLVKHLDDGLGLRQICDWMGFVANELDDDIWKSEFQPVLRKARLENIACITTKMCKKYLGLSEKITWCDSADDKTCDEFMRYVMDNGNFGRKDENNKRSTVLAGNASSGKGSGFLYFMKKMQSDGKNQWKAAARFPVLKLIAWAYVPTRYLVRIITGKRTIKQTGALLKKATDKKKLEDKLSVFR